VSGPRFWWDGALDISPRPLDLQTEMAKLAERAREAASQVAERALAEVVRLARSPLPQLDEAEEAALRASAARAATVTAASKPCRRRGFTVDVRRRKVLTASGAPVPNGYALVNACLHGEVVGLRSRRRRRPG
jgi:hypothetical protein